MLSRKRSHCLRTNPNSHITISMKCHSSCEPAERSSHSALLNLAGKVAATVDERQDAEKQTRRRGREEAECRGAELRGPERQMRPRTGSTSRSPGRTVLVTPSARTPSRRQLRPPPASHADFDDFSAFLRLLRLDYLSISNNRISRTHGPQIACQYTETASAAVMRDKRRSGRKATAASAATPPRTCNLACAAVNT